MVSSTDTAEGIACASDCDEHEVAVLIVIVVTNRTRKPASLVMKQYNESKETI